MFNAKLFTRMASLEPTSLEPSISADGQTIRQRNSKVKLEQSGLKLTLWAFCTRPVKSQICLCEYDHKQADTCWQTVSSNMNNTGAPVSLISDSIKCYYLSGFLDQRQLFIIHLSKIPRCRSALQKQQRTRNTI